MASTPVEGLAAELHELELWGVGGRRIGVFEQTSYDGKNQADHRNRSTAYYSKQNLQLKGRETKKGHTALRHRYSAATVSGL